MKKNTIIFIICIVVLAAGFGLYSYMANQNPQEVPVETETQDEQNRRVMSVEDYVKLNISELSPEKEVLGGKYYVTEIEARGGAGTVKYEDGHNAYVADFTYTTDEIGAITITSFLLRK
jgi:hypothetical protein